VPSVDLPELPLVILLGDRHGQDKLCDPCEEEKGCMRVFDPSFLKILDKLARDVPVDFFLENTWDFDMVGASHDDPSQILFSRMNGATKDCYDVGKRSQSSYLAACPTQFVRWHYAETRFENTRDDFIERALASFMFYLEDQFDTYLDPTKDYPSFFWKGMYHGVDIAFVETVLDQVFLPSSFEFDLITFYQTIVDALFLHLNSHPSMIRKQLEKVRKQADLPEQKLSLLSRFDEKSLKKALIKYLTTHQELQFMINVARHPSTDWKWDETLRRECRDALKSMINKDRDQPWRVPKFFDTPEKLEILEGVISCVHYMFLKLTSCLLDLYAVARMVKLPEENDRAILHLGYYGEAHCARIASLLKQTLHYRMVTEITKSQDSNCIKFDKPIYLESEVRWRADHRYRAYGAEYGPLKGKYQQRIRDEVRSRTVVASKASSSVKPSKASTRATKVSRRSRSPNTASASSSNYRSRSRSRSPQPTVSSRTAPAGGLSNPSTGAVQRMLDFFKQYKPSLPF
jgi:hypothetical protein